MERRSWLMVASVLGVAAALFALPVEQAWADLVVDHFTQVQNPPGSVSLQANPSPPPATNWSFSGSASSWTMTGRVDTGSGSVSESGLGSVLGGSRFSELNLIATPASDDTVRARLAVSTASSVAQLFLDSDVDANAVFSYDASGGGLNQNLSTATSIDLVIASTDLGVSVVVTLGSGNGAQSASSPVQNLGAPGTISIPITAFTTANPSLQLSDIDSIRVAIDTPMAGDFTMDEIIVRQRQEVIPEPASLLIWSVLGVAGVFYGRRRWMR